MAEVFFFFFTLKLIAETSLDKFLGTDSGALLDKDFCCTALYAAYFHGIKISLADLCHF